MKLKSMVMVSMIASSVFGASSEDAYAPPGKDNIAFGYGSGFQTSGLNTNVVLIGTDAGKLTSGNEDCIFIGANAGMGLTGQKGSVVLGDVLVSTSGVTTIKGLFDGVSFGIVDCKIAVYTNGVFVMYLSGGGAQTVSVSFDTDYGDALSSTSVVKGAGFTPPTDINKFATTLGGIADGAFTLEGWYTDAAKTVRYNGEAINSDCTLYAKWTDNRVITPHSADGSYLTDGFFCSYPFGIGSTTFSISDAALNPIRIGVTYPAKCVYRIINTSTSESSNPFTNDVVNVGGVATFPGGEFNRDDLTGVTMLAGYEYGLETRFISPGGEDFCVTNDLFVSWD